MQPDFTSTLKPKEGDRSTGRLREIEVLAHVMDALATNNIAGAADIVSQRMLACKMADEDGSWNRAQFAELIPTDSINMVSREMRNMTQREEASQKRMAKPATPADAWGYPGGNPAHDPAENPLIVKKGGKSYKKGWIEVGKGGKPPKKDWWGKKRYEDKKKNQ